MNYFIVIAILGFSTLASACTAAGPDAVIVKSPREQMRVLSESQPKGSVDELDEAERSATERARDALASWLSTERTSFELVAIQRVEWSDSSLGCPQPRQSYLQVITPGHRVVLRHKKQTYRVHVAKDTATVCQDLGKGPFQRASQPINALAFRRMQQQARQDLATKFNVPTEEIEVGIAIPSQWPDASLGCPTKGIHYPPGVRNGFRIPLKYRGRTVFYHTDGQRVFACPAIEYE